MRWVIRVAAVVAALALGTATQAEDEALMIVLPTGVLPLAVSSSGVVVGGLRTGGGFHWMPTSGTVFIGGLQALAVSRDGRTITGEAFDANRIQQAAIWQRASEWRLLGSITPTARPCDRDLSTAIGSSDDGKTLVGLAWDTCAVARAFRWEEGTGMVNLGSTVTGRSSRANSVSGDGKVVVGWQELISGYWQAAKWVNGTQTLYTGDAGPLGQAWATNSSGSIIVGQVCRPGDLRDQSAWVWTARDGMACLPVPILRPAIEGSFLGIAQATSEDGRVIGGGHSFGLESESIIWIDRQPHYLKAYLREHGVPNAFEGWFNTGFVTDISRDGRVLVGYGAGPKDFTGYVVVLPGLGEQK